MSEIHGIKTVYQVSEGAYDDWTDLAIFDHEEDAQQLAAQPADHGSDNRVVTPLPMFAAGQYRSMFIDGDWKVWFVEFTMSGDLERVETRPLTWLHYVWSQSIAGWSGSLELTYSAFVLAETEDDAVAQAQAMFAADPDIQRIRDAHDEWLSLPRESTPWFFPWLRGEDAA